jgi:hypothetical protein
MSPGISDRGTKYCIVMILTYGRWFLIAMHINPSTNNRVGLYSQGDNHYLQGMLCSGQRELCTPLVRHSTPIRHLGKKNRGPDFDTFSPLGTEYHFAKNSFVPQV